MSTIYDMYRSMTSYMEETKVITKSQGGEIRSRIHRDETNEILINERRAEAARRQRNSRPWWKRILDWIVPPA